MYKRKIVINVFFRTNLLHNFFSFFFFFLSKTTKILPMVAYNENMSDNFFYYLPFFLSILGIFSFFVSFTTLKRWPILTNSFMVCVVYKINLNFKSSSYCSQDSVHDEDRSSEYSEAIFKF
uniref:Uncharacterized protein n=1 Tax=Cacopsylla melanoneura TaxID=428564 RepID=A0A8D9AA14_9HEMI